MRIHLLSIFAFAILAFATPARAYDPEFSKIVSYSQLMSLSPEKRVEYIRQVRLIVTEFEGIQKNVSGGSSAVADATERNLFLDMMIRDANAAVFLNMNPSKRPLSASERASAYQTMYKCPPLRYSNPNIPRRLRENGAEIACVSQYLYVGCPRGFREIGKAGRGSKRICYKEGLSDQQVARIRATAKRDAEAKAKREANEKARLVAAKKARTARKAKSAEASRRLASSERDGERVAKSAESANQEQMAGIGDADAVEDPQIEGTTSEDDQSQHANRNLPEYRVTQRSEGQLFQIEKNGKIDTKNVADQQCKDRISIDPPTETCNDTTIANARRDYYRTDNPHCLFGGNLRHYSNNQKRPGMCQHPKEFCLSNVQCRKTDGSYVNPNEKIVVKCADSKKVICNPLLFNLDENDQALCVEPTKDATEACNKRADEVEQHLKDQGKDSIPFVTRLRLKPRANEDQMTTSLTGIKEAWDDFANQMNSICDQTPSKDLYCRECPIMKKRAADLNFLVFNGGKPDANGNCYSFFHQMKGLDEKGHEIKTAPAQQAAPAQSGK